MIFQSPSTMTQSSQGITQLTSQIGSSVNSLLNSSAPQLTSQVQNQMSPAMINTSQPFDVSILLKYKLLMHKMMSNIMDIDNLELAIPYEILMFYSAILTLLSR